MNNQKLYTYNSYFNCFIELNYCENNPNICQNGAKCISLIQEEGSYKCLCREGTYGKNCEHSEISTTIKPKTTTAKTANLTTVATTESLDSEEVDATTETTESSIDNETV